MDYISHYQSPLGDITMASDGRFLTGLWFDGQKHFSATLGAEHEERDLPLFGQTMEWLDIYFSGRNPDFRLPLLVRGTKFRREVWNLLLAIPYGQTLSYAAMARRMAESRGQSHMSAQAVGGAVGHNPISIIIPCHRVVGLIASVPSYTWSRLPSSSLRRRKNADSEIFLVEKLWFLLKSTIFAAHIHNGLDWI